MSSVKKPDPHIVAAQPTKALFIDMLTRDIGLIPAIVDLADNGTDGAQRMRGERKFDGLWVRVSFDKNEFKIADNCGGISVDVARKYAFRFGRPGEAPTIKHSVGQFGVGMKRALFKIGKTIHVESTSESSRFALDIDVDTWARDDATWEFRFTELEENLAAVPEKDRGTIITVGGLREAVANEFGLGSFATELKNELEMRILHPLSRGMAITVNEIPLGVEPLTFLNDNRIAPVCWEDVYRKKGEKRVKVKLFCGLGEARHREMAGWHVFCNGRLILSGDKTRVTGWGDRAGEISIPGFHGQYNAFRGYAFFDSDDAGRLPWNTTKTGINVDSEIWSAVRLEMIGLMHPVKAFLDSLKNEKEEQERDGTDEPGPLQEIVDSAQGEDMHKVETRDVFMTPKRKSKPKPKGPRMGNIGYAKPVDAIKTVMRSLGARSYKEAGEMTFDYYLESECED